MASTQPNLDFSLPVSGRTPHARHASASGARHASERRGQQTLAYLKLLAECGPLSDPSAARMLGVGVSSICSIRNGLGALVRSSGAFETVTWPSGGQTKRVKWERA